MFIPRFMWFFFFFKYRFFISIYFYFYVKNTLNKSRDIVSLTNKSFIYIVYINIGYKSIQLLEYFASIYFILK